MKLRLRFAKLGRLRWTSHRDVARMWERALRRAGAPVGYSAGFSPRPLVAFGLALPTGCESTAEYLDVSLTSPVDVGPLARGLDSLLPEGLSVLAAAAVDPAAPSLQETVDWCAWDIEVPSVPEAGLEEAVLRLLAAGQAPVTRRRKGRVEVEDLRPSVRVLEVRCGSSPPMIGAELATRPRGVRPSELAEALGLELGAARRTCQWIECDGRRVEPLALGPAGALPAMGRAS